MRPRRPRRKRLGAVDIFRFAVAVFLVFGLFATLSWLQGRYDASDHRKARELVETYRAGPSGPTIPEIIQARHPGTKPHEIGWSSEITSGCQGIVRLSAHVPGQGGVPASTYAFDIRLTDSSIHPADPAAIEVLKALTSTRASGAPVRGSTTADSPASR